MTHQSAKHRKLSEPARSSPITLTRRVSGLIRSLEMTWKRDYQARRSKQA